MSNQILDEVEKHTKPRTCPNCGHVFPLGRFVMRFILSFGFLKWRCGGCGEILKCDFVKLQLYWGVGLVICLGLLAVVRTQFDFGDKSIFVMLLYFPFVLWTMYHVKFEKDN